MIACSGETLYLTGLPVSCRSHPTAVGRERSSADGPGFFALNGSNREENQALPCQKLTFDLQYSPPQSGRQFLGVRPHSQCNRSAADRAVRQSDIRRSPLVKAVNDPNHRVRLSSGGLHSALYTSGAPLIHGWYSFASRIRSPIDG